MTTLTMADLPPIRWSCDGNTITATRGHLSASVDAPINGWYTDAREWTKDVLTALRIAESKLIADEFRERV